MNTSAFRGNHPLMLVLDYGLLMTEQTLNGFRAASRVTRSALPYTVKDRYVLNRQGEPVGVDLVAVLVPHLDLSAFDAWRLSPGTVARLDAFRPRWEAPIVSRRLFVDHGAPWLDRDALAAYQTRLLAFRQLIGGPVPPGVRRARAERAELCRQ